MTRKDYIKIAEIFKSHEYLKESPTLFGVLVMSFADMLQKDNPRFDREKFINYINK